MPSASICRSSRISTDDAAARRRCAAARAANSRGVSALPGSLASSRARLLHSPSSRPRCDGALDTRPALGRRVVERRQDDRRFRRRLRRIDGLVDARVELGERQPLDDCLHETRKVEVAGGIAAGPGAEEIRVVRLGADAPRARPRSRRVGLPPSYTPPGGPRRRTGRGAPSTSRRSPPRQTGRTPAPQIPSSSSRAQARLRPRGRDRRSPTAGRLRTRARR